MLTHCPECGAWFRLQTAQLEAAAGLVRCGQCNAVFNALEALHAEPDERGRATGDNNQPKLPLFEQDASVTRPDADRLAPLRPESDSAPAADDHAEAPATPAELGDATVPTGDAGTTGPLQLDPDWIVQHQTHTGLAGRSVAWLGGCLLLIGVFIAELQLVDPSALNRSGWLHSLATQVCGLTGCEAPARRAPENIRVLSRSIRPHPHRDDALRLELTFSNAAEFAQPPPFLLIGLLDENDRTVARRAFDVSEYALSTVARMAPGERVQARLDVVDPGEQAVGFEIEFL